MSARPHRWRGLLCLLLGTAIVSACTDSPPGAEPTATARSGQEAYAAACASCHEGQVARAPHRTMLEIMSPHSVVRALTTGVMQQESMGLSTAERHAVAEYLTGRSLDASALAAVPQCPETTVDTFDASRPPFVRGWGFDPHNTRAIPDAVAGIGIADLNRLELRWAFAFPDAVRARSAPAVAAGRVFTGSHNGDVYALDMATGCVHWTFHAAAEVRTAIIIEDWDPTDAEADPKLFFGDLLGNVYGISARSGELRWRHRPDAHPNATITGSPSLHDGRLFVPVSSLEVVPAARSDYPCCTFRGSVVAYEAATGEPLWQTFTIEQEPIAQEPNRVGTPNFGPSGAPIWNSPAVDPKRGLIYAATGENYSSPATATSDAIFAFDMATGDVRWVYQATEGDAWNTACDMPDDANCPEEDGPDFDFGAAVLLAESSNGQDLVIGGQKSGKVHAVNADTGELVWQTRVGRGGIQGGIHFGMAKVGDRLFVPINDMPDGREYPHPDRPGLHALDVPTGAPLWSYHSPHDVCQGRQFCDPGISQAISATSELVLAGALDGVLRIHSAASGEVLWSLDTTEPFPTVDGGESQGGSMSGAPGPLLVDGMLFITTGYGIYNHMPGNLLLAFGLVPAADTADTPDED